MAFEETLISDSNNAFMELALEQARIALENLEVPVGCVIVEDGNVIASGRNRTTETRNATRHAEMDAIDSLLRKWQKIGLDQLQVAEIFSKCDIHVTCEPCIMCASALFILEVILRIGKVLSVQEESWQRKPLLFYEVSMSREILMLQNLTGQSELPSDANSAF